MHGTLNLPIPSTCCTKWTVRSPARPPGRLAAGITTLGAIALVLGCAEVAPEPILASTADILAAGTGGPLALRTPAGTELLGGTMEMAAGGTAYYTVNIAPGTYAWITEVPDPAAKNMLKTFTVPSARGGTR